MCIRDRRHLCHINVAVTDGFHGQILLAVLLAAGSKLGHCSTRSSLGHLAAGVGVDFRVENQHIDVLAATQHVVQSTEADVVGLSLIHI